MNDNIMRIERLYNQLKDCFKPIYRDDKLSLCAAELFEVLSQHIILDSKKIDDFDKDVLFILNKYKIYIKNEMIVYLNMTKFSSSYFPLKFMYDLLEEEKTNRLINSNNEFWVND